MSPTTPGSRLTRARSLLAVLAVGLAWANADAAAGVISSVTVRGDDTVLEVDVAATGPLGYLVSESAEPFTLTLLFADTRLGFPDERRSFSGHGLSEIDAKTLIRQGKTLAKIDLTFDRTAPYDVTREGSRVRVRTEVPGPSLPIVIGRPGESSPAGVVAPAAPPVTAPPVAPREAGASPGAPRPTAASPAAAPQAAQEPSDPVELRGVRPESGKRGARLVLDLDGTPAFRTFTRTGPARVVVDIENARFARKERSIAVGGALLRGVRVSQYTATVVRVVCDLSQPAPFRVERVPTGLVIHLGGGVR